MSLKSDRLELDFSICDVLHKLNDNFHMRNYHFQLNMDTVSPIFRAVIGHVNNPVKLCLMCFC